MRVASSALCRRLGGAKKERRWSPRHRLPWGTSQGLVEEQALMSGGTAAEHHEVLRKGVEVEELRAAINRVMEDEIFVF